jgi:peptidylprolyl isomerase
MVLVVASCSPEDVVRRSGGTDSSDTGMVVVYMDGKYDSIASPDQRKKDKPVEWQTLPNGVKIRYHRRGKGNHPVMEDVVEYDFTKKPVGGKVFDASRSTGKPVAVMLGLDLILKAWQEAIMTLVPGDSVTMVIPSSLAYGGKGLDRLVPPDTDLEISMNLRRVIKPETADNNVLIYRFTDGAGPFPADGQTITTKYFAFHRKGTMYDASARNNAPFTFRLGQGNMMAGLMDGFRKLRKGDWAYLVIPADRAFGSKGLQDLVPPNTDVVYMVEVIDIQ